MPIISRRRLGPPRDARAGGPLSLGGDDIGRNLSGSLWRRRLAIRVLALTAIVLPAVGLLVKQGFTGKALILVPATGAFMILIDRVAMIEVPVADAPPRWATALLPVIVGLGAALLAAGGLNWLTTLAIAAAAVGRLSPQRQRAALGIAGCSAIALAVGLWLHLSYGTLLTATGVPALAGFISYGAQRRNVLIYRLAETRAELAQLAVAQERLRIARDLHDLLGHSLSLIALKAELAGRVLPTDSGRAAKEIAELETVARQSLTEVREAVSGYRQPSIAAELALARRMLAAASIDCDVRVPAAHALPAALDALLGWTIREGTTNIVRHSGATRAQIRVESDGDHAHAELTDNGAGPLRNRPVGPAAPTSGSGLAGLAERAARHGGALTAGTTPGGGFRLRVSVPLGQASPGTDAQPVRAAEATA